MRRERNVIEGLSDGARAVREAVCAMVDRPESVEIVETAGRDVRLVQVVADPGDVPRVIGRDGRTVDALRSILRAIGGREGLRYVLEVSRSDGGR